MTFVSTSTGLFGTNTTMMGTPGGEGGAEGFVVSNNGKNFMNTGGGGTGQVMLESKGIFNKYSQYIETPDGFIQVSGGGLLGRDQNILVQTADYTYSLQGGKNGTTVYKPTNQAVAGAGQIGVPPATDKNGSVDGSNGGPVQKPIEAPQKETPAQKPPTQVGGESGAPVQKPVQTPEQAPVQKAPTKVGGAHGHKHHVQKQTPVQKGEPTQKATPPTQVGGASGVSDAHKGCQVHNAFGGGGATDAIGGAGNIGNTLSNLLQKLMEMINKLLSGFNAQTPPSKVAGESGAPVQKAPAKL